MYRDKILDVLASFPEKPLYLIGMASNRTEFGVNAGEIRIEFAYTPAYDEDVQGMTCRALVIKGVEVKGEEYPLQWVFDTFKGYMEESGYPDGWAEANHENVLFVCNGGGAPLALEECCPGIQPMAGEGCFVTPAGFQFIDLVKIDWGEPEFAEYTRPIRRLYYEVFGEKLFLSTGSKGLAIIITEIMARL